MRTYFTSSTATSIKKAALRPLLQPQGLKVILSNVISFYGFCALGLKSTEYKASVPTF
jgi:hypothetical protein